MRDGLYLVEAAHFTAGFVIRGGKIVSCAPILRRHLDFWLRTARYLGP